MREEERKEFCGEIREFTDVARRPRADCRRGCQGIAYFRFLSWNAYDIVTSVRKRLIVDIASMIDSKILRKVDKKIELCEDIDSL